jgi:hypothetical protein
MAVKIFLVSIFNFYLLSWHMNNEVQETTKSFGRDSSAEFAIP